MRIILLSGGSGKRLWPMSNDVRSKQFLRVLRRDSDGAPESMIQRVVRQLGDAAVADGILVATGASQRDFIHNQLGDAVSVVTEPERRDTFPAIALACSYLAMQQGVDADETVVVMPCDTFTEPSYFEVIGKMGDAVKANRADIVLMGICPTRPASQFGYILPKEDGITVSEFREKPPVEVAEKLIANGALWNGGVFAFRLGYLTDIVKRYLPEAEKFEDVYDAYGSLPKISFDYEVVEHADSICVIPFKGMWKDLGTWQALTENLSTQTQGNVVTADCVDTHVINELPTPILCEGLEHMVVVATPDGILIADKERSDRIKNHAAAIAGRPMFEERRWGWYRVIGTSEYPDGHRTLTKELHINPGCAISYQTHNNRDEIWTVVDGKGQLALDGTVSDVSRGSVVHIMRGQRHSIRAVTPLEIIEVQSGNPLVEDDIERFPFTWE